MAQLQSLRFIDIGSNLSDPVFRGWIRGHQKHPDDLSQVMRRAKEARVVAQITTGDNLKNSRSLLSLSAELPELNLFQTAGVHPTRSTEAAKNPSKYFADLGDLISRHKRKPGQRSGIVAVGECGLDYDRLFLAPKEDQLRAFPPQLELASQHDLPLFLHSRTSEAHQDFVRIIKEHGKPLRGVVHSHTGTREEAKELIQLGFYIGINGCSLKTEENLEAVKHLPLDRLMLETDCPWCEIRPSHASHRLVQPLLTDPRYEAYKTAFVPPAIKAERHSVDKMVKGRNEPCTIGQVAWCVAALKEVPLEEVVQAAYMNTIELFGLQDVALDGGGPA